jgi:hypothetical protein
MQFMAAGTMDVLGWHQGALASIMPFAAFEVCALEPGGDAPLLVVAVTRNKHAIHLLTYDGTEEKLVSAWHAKVSPPDDGEHYNVPRGFALACSYPQERPHRVQYKNRTFTLARSGDALVEGPKAKRPGQ